MTVTVCKLGGSLLTLPDLAKRLARFLETLAEQRVLFVIGGGAAADVVREWDRQHHLSPEQAHRLALTAMMLNETFVAELLPNARIVGSRMEVRQIWDEGRVAILCANRFLEVEEQSSADRLPHTWDVTSDSIAAWVAIRWPAERLVLLKSIDAPHSRSSSREAVDSYFDQLAQRLPCIDWVNLRAEPIVTNHYRPIG